MCDIYKNIVLHSEAVNVNATSLKKRRYKLWGHVCFMYSSLSLSALQRLLRDVCIQRTPVYHPTFPTLMGCGYHT